MTDDPRLLAEVIVEDNPARLESFRALKIHRTAANCAYALGLYLKDDYTHELSNAIRSSKENIHPYARRFARALALFIRNVEPYFSANFIVSIPARPAEEDRLARVLEQLGNFGLAGVDIDPAGLKASADLPRLRSIRRAKERRDAVFGRLTSRYIYNDGGTVVLIDDVHTSGATTDEAVRALKSAGLERVLVLTIAKTARDPGERDYAIRFRVQDIGHADVGQFTGPQTVESPAQLRPTTAEQESEEQVQPEEEKLDDAMLAEYIQRFAPLQWEADLSGIVWKQHPAITLEELRRKLTGGGGVRRVLTAFCLYRDPFSQEWRPGVLNLVYEPPKFRHGDPTEGYLGGGVTPSSIQFELYDRETGFIERGDFARIANYRAVRLIQIYADGPNRKGVIVPVTT